MPLILSGEFKTDFAMKSLAPNVTGKRNGWLPRWCGFWISAPLLVASVLWEGVYSAFAALWLLFRRDQARARVRRILLGSRAVLGVGVIAALLGLSGCGSFPGTSFRFQVNEFMWSTKTLLHMESGPGEVLEDMQSIFIGETSFEQLGDTFEQLGW